MFHAQGISLVYGGGSAGIMGEVARTLVGLSGPQAVHGVIPSALIRFERDVVQNKAAEKLDQTMVSDESTRKQLLSESEFGRTSVVPDMHTRKQLMAQEVMAGGEGSGFVALSGGYGTLEELMEVTTCKWDRVVTMDASRLIDVTGNQLGIHSKPIIVYNVDGYYDGLLSWVRNAVESGFISEGNRNIMVETKTPEEVLKALQTYRIAEGQFKLDWKQK